MAKFRHIFQLKDSGESCRIYASGDNRLRLDFVSGTCLRVAVYKAQERLLPTFSVAPANRMDSEGRERLDTKDFPLYTPACRETQELDSFTLAEGIEVTLQKENALLSYRQNGKPLFSDRAPLAYNLAGEFGCEQYHYITKEADEYIFGLGDKGGDLNKAGRAFRIETTDCMGYDAAETDPLYKHIPFFMCQTKAGCYGIFYDTAATSYMDCGKEINNYYAPYKYFKSEDNCLVYYVFFGSKFSILQQFCRLCGKQAFPPRWSFHFCGSTMAYTDAPDAQKQMDAFLAKLHETGLPCAGFYLSSGYTSIDEKRCVFHWNRDKFPDPAAFIKSFRAENIHLIPNIKPAFLTTHPLYAALAKQGLFIQNEDGTPFVTAFWDGLGSYLDFTHPQAVAFWQQQLKETLLDYGMDCTWNDNNEMDIKDRDARACGFGSGAVPAYTIRPILTYLMVAASHAAQIKKYPQQRPFLSTRSGGIGIRRLAQTWSGDNRTAFEDLRYCHNIGLTMSLSGLSFYGHDVGGFYGDMPSRELLLRWIQHGIFEPRFTIHSWNQDGSATMPWSYPDILEAVKALFAQRERLLPYLYNCAYRAVEEEIPLNAPPLLYYDDAPLYAQNDTMLVGTDILVPFIFEQGQTQTKVYLPMGENWYLGETRYTGGNTVTLTIPPDKPMPYFVKAGSVIPTAEEEQIVFTVYPLAGGSFESRYFWDDGESFAYKDGACVDVRITAECEENTVTVSYQNTGKNAFTPAFRLCAADKRTLIVK
ncbi:MAG: DUF5110 domain-containing protein [Clostridia bacterium]|nr:DUF5110 domain-containing protein [Clostridia bacterium]